MEQPNLNLSISMEKENPEVIEKYNESEITPELEKLRKYSERIFEVAGDFESVYSYFDPMGVDPETGKPRSYKEEKEDFYERIKTNSKH